MKKLLIFGSMLAMTVMFTSSCQKEPQVVPANIQQVSPIIDTFVYINDQVNVHDIQSNTNSTIQWGASTQGDMVVYTDNSIDYIKNVAYPLYNNTFVCTSTNPLVFGGYTTSGGQILNCTSYVISDTLHLHYEMSTTTAYYTINATYLRTY